MKVLVTGGAGYIGSHAVRELIRSKHEVVALDNLSRGHRQAVCAEAKLIEGDAGNSAMLESLLRAEKIDAVMHFAAFLEVAESVALPGKYYLNNFGQTLGLLEAMKNTGVKRLIFSSTAAVYGNCETSPILETSPLNPINPYGRSKLMSEMAIQDYSLAHGIEYTILRYFNVAGAATDGSIGEDHRPETHLIPLLLQAALDQKKEVKLFGTDYPTPDGSCVRDYIHVVDLARAHIEALEQPRKSRNEIFNLGSESGFSVKEVIRACEAVSGRKISVKECERRPGDPAILIASSQKIKDTLKWHPSHPDLEAMIGHAWKWHQLSPNGYSD